MCNAFNHSYNCTCGWGGDGHAGRNSGNYSNNQALPKFKTYFQILRSSTIPNATCPVCGARVFFYRSEFGGRVFFDELGPPWPKHPCTDNGKIVLTRNIEFSDDMPVKVFSGLPNEWQPFLCLGITVIGINKDIYEISGYVNGIAKTFYTKVIGLSDKYPFFIKENDDATRTSSLINVDRNLKYDEFIVSIYLTDVQTSSPNIEIDKNKLSRVHGDENSKKKAKKRIKERPRSIANIERSVPEPKFDNKLQEQLRLKVLGKLK